MAVRKEVFISATSADLGSYRQVSKDALLTLGAHPIEEKNFPTDYRELQALLARRLDPCDAVIHLVGFHYGGEPDPTSGTVRRSWTQWEYYRAAEGEHPKPMYRFLAREDCAFDARPAEDVEKQRLQLGSLAAADALDLPEQTSKEQEARRVGVMRWLATAENAKRTVLILDNADSVAARQALRELLPKVAACAVLITSRYGGDLGGVRMQELALFTPEEAREYLRSHLHAGSLAQSDGEATLDALAQEVDHWPLALELVVSYIHESRQSPAEWLEEWRKTPVPTLTYHDADAVNYPVSLARVWEQSISQTSPTAHEILHLLAWLAPRPATFPLLAFRQAEDWPRVRVTLGELAKVFA